MHVQICISIYLILGKKHYFLWCFNCEKAKYHFFLRMWAHNIK